MDRTATPLTGGPVILGWPRIHVATQRSAGSTFCDWGHCGGQGDCLQLYILRRWLWMGKVWLVDNLDVS